MIKLLYKPTGITWVVPDEEALRTVKEDNDKLFEIIDAGVTEDSDKGFAGDIQEEELSEEVPNEAIQQPVKPSLKHVNEEEYLAMDLDIENASAVELRGYCGRLGIKVKAQESKKSMIQKIKATGIVE